MPTNNKMILPALGRSKSPFGCSAISAVLLASSFNSTPGQPNKAPTDVDNHHDCDNHGKDCNTVTPIKQVIVIVGENRSFDHLFATYLAKPGETVNNLLSEGVINGDKAGRYGFIS